MNRTTINVGGRRISVERSRIRMGENVLSVAEPRQATGRGRFGVVSKERRTIDGVTFDSGKEAKRWSCSSCVLTMSP
jgi:hypothetical protein